MNLTGNKVFNGDTILVIVFTIESLNDNAIVFSRYSNGKPYDFIIGHQCTVDGKNVTWTWGHYGYKTMADAIADTKRMIK